MYAITILSKLQNVKSCSNITSNTLVILYPRTLINSHKLVHVLNYKWTLCFVSEHYSHFLTAAVRSSFNLIIELPYGTILSITTLKNGQIVMYRLVIFFFSSLPYSILYFQNISTVNFLFGYCLQCSLNCL